MKKVALSIAALALTTGSALAADLPTHKAPAFAPPPPPPMWTGFYAGLNAGYGFGTNSNSVTGLWIADSSWSRTVTATGFAVSSGPLAGGAIGSTASMTQYGFVGGGQIGYNMQVAERYVIGFEADFQGSTVRGNSSSPSYGYFGRSSQNVINANTDVGTQAGTTATNVSAGLNYLGTARGRLGFLLTPTLLVYGTGGLAYGGAWASVATTGFAGTTSSVTAVTYPGVSQYFYGNNHASNTLVGYSVGGGAEWMFLPNWSIKGEAIYYNLGNMNVGTYAVSGAASGAPVDAAPPTLFLQQLNAGAVAIVGSTRVNYQGIVARAGVNYHFNFGGSAPVFAKN